MDEWLFPQVRTWLIYYLGHSGPCPIFPFSPAGTLRDFSIHSFTSYSFYLEQRSPHAPYHTFLDARLRTF
jgi:hypothetical protein